MLFDLRGRGRRTTVKVIYSFLAILIGGGLVFFGIGGATNGGGLFDALNQQTDVQDTYSKEVASLKRQLARNPKSEAGWARLAKLQVQQASAQGYIQNTNSYNAEGKAKLAEASASWNRYLKLQPKKVNSQLAAIMVTAYSQGGLNQPKEAAKALKEAIRSRKPSAALYSQLAILSYQAGDKNESRIAEKRALDLAPKSKRKLIKAQLAAQKAQLKSAQQAQQQAPPQ